MMSYWVLGSDPTEPAIAPSRSPMPKKDPPVGSLDGAYPAAPSSSRIATASTSSTGSPTTCIRSPPRPGRPPFPLPYGDWDSDHHDITYSYPNGIEGWLITIKHTAGYRDVKEQFYGAKGMLETARTYYKLHGPIANSPYKNADDLTDSSLIERRTSTREITIDAVEAFYASIREGKPYNMAPIAANATFTSILGRMAYQQKREVTWDEMLKSAA